MRRYNAAEIIERYDEINENEVDADIKLEWIQSLEMLIYDEIIKTHEDDPIEAMIKEDMFESVEEYFDSFDMETPLLAPMPYHEIYMNWIDKKIAERYKETNKFNASVNLFNSSYITFMDAYNRKHLPLQKMPNIMMRVQ